MSKMIQIRNVPEELHRTLKAKAALSGESLSDLIMRELSRMAALPSYDELKKRLSEAQPFDMSESSAAMVREERDTR